MQPCKVLEDVVDVYHNHNRKDLNIRSNDETLLTAL